MTRSIPTPQVAAAARWLVGPGDRRVKAAVAAGALPLALAVAGLLAVAGAAPALWVAAGAAAGAGVLGVAAALLGPRELAEIEARIAWASEGTRPLELRVDEAAPPRLNVVISLVDLDHFFGGYIAIFNLARRLAERGLRVRIVASDRQPRLPDGWRREVESYAGLHGLFERVEVEFAYDAGELIVSPRDSFVATTTRTAHVAHHATTAVGRQRFLFLIQEHESFVVREGASAAMAVTAYDLPHYAIFSTELLLDYFRAHRVGVFAGPDGDHVALAFRNAITPVGPVSEEELARRPGRTLLLYARPEPHAERNMFDLAVAALRTAVAGGVFGDEWAFAGVGSVRDLGAIRLAAGRELELRRRTGQAEYRELLRTATAGLALMLTPHPSLVPIEMAAAGLVTVTNTFDNKTAAALRAISPNLIAAAPTLDGISGALHEAAARSTDLAARAAGAAVDWPSEWDAAFPDALVSRAAAWIEAG